jgi:hypothetical protein
MSQSCRRMFDPKSTVNESQDATLASLSELNHSLRQQVVELLLSIAILKETAGPELESRGDRAKCRSRK